MKKIHTRTALYVVGAGGVALLVVVAWCMLRTDAGTSASRVVVGDEHPAFVPTMVHVDVGEPNTQTMDEETLKRVVGAGPQRGTFKAPTAPPPGR